ncbi:MAG TPA: phage baseplate assembly protein V [Candidatus Binataceae bacterium]|nr:phage baseplate assembly protein V [Candidatus Binataceae bacterium]
MFRVGLVRQQDVQGARVRVAFPDRDQMLSYWLPIVAFKTQDDKGYWMPDLGEQVVCLMDERDEAGAVLGAIYSTADTPPVHSADKFHVAFKDGASFEYDRAAHALALNLPKGATMKISLNGASLAIDASGNLTLVPADGAQLQLGAAGQMAGVARLGDAVQVTDDEGGTLHGTITSASTDVVAN